jgi:hypothetical protein
MVNIAPDRKGGHMKISRSAYIIIAVSFVMAIYLLLQLIPIGNISNREANLLPAINQTQLTADTPTQIITLERPSATILPTITETQIFYPDSGTYIAYQIGMNRRKYINLVSIEGIEVGTLMEGGSEGRSWLSPDQTMVAYSTELHNIRIRYLQTGDIITIPDWENCRFGVTQLSWNSDSNILVVNCSHNLQFYSLTEGVINKKIDNIVLNDENYAYDDPKWSPNGKWISFVMQTHGTQLTSKGPLLTDISCLTNDNDCDRYTYHQLEGNVDYRFAWTPENNFAILDPWKRIINIYKIPYFNLVNRISIPEKYYFIDSISWSRNEEWFAFSALDKIYITSVITGEIRQVSSQGERVLFWLEVE